MTTRYRVVGRCYACGLVVYTEDASFVYDPAVKTSSGKKVRRVVHRDGCRARVETMFITGKVGNA